MLSLHFLHGFLGKPSDWNFVQNNLESASLHFEDLSLYSDDDFISFAKKYNEKILSKEQGCEKKVLIGYSMGGRLALQALFDSEFTSRKVWHAAILISTNPGLECANARQKRLIEDEKWALRFENDPWQDLMKDWNLQAVFQSKLKKTNFLFDRKEEDYNRRDLAKNLTFWSLGNQKSFKELLKEVDIPILWMAGAEDEKFVSLSNSIFLKHPLSSICIMKGASHRLPWECQDIFIKRVQEFLITLGFFRN